MRKYPGIASSPNRSLSSSLWYRKLRVNLSSTLGNHFHRMRGKTLESLTDFALLPIAAAAVAAVASAVAQFAAQQRSRNEQYRVVVTGPQLPSPAHLSHSALFSLLLPAKRKATAVSGGSEVRSGTRRGKWKNFRTYYIYFSITFFFSIWFLFCYTFFYPPFTKFVRRLRFCSARHVVFNLFWQQLGTGSIK